MLYRQLAISTFSPLCHYFAILPNIVNLLFVHSYAKKARKYWPSSFY